MRQSSALLRFITSRGHFILFTLKKVSAVFCAARLPTALAALVALTSCHRPTAASSGLKVISNRPSFDHFLAIVKLQSPALLASATVVDGRAVISSASRAALATEQERALEEFRRLSPEIHVLYQYRLVLNGFAVVAPKALEEHFRAMTNVSTIEGDVGFERMEVMDSAESPVDDDLASHNSVSFIGAHAVHSEQQLRGKGVRVGVIDTGIDYTHSMFGGLGTKAAYDGTDVTHASAAFPSAKVVGGIDLVGTEYDSGADDFSRHIPHGDANPIDESGHGTHVAGTIAGIGDGVTTYTGVAPDATLVAIKVFGKSGSTSDTAVIAALEYAANPGGDLTATDSLDVVNLSLGSGFGSPHVQYSEAIANLTRGGTVVVASAGNSGNHSYIVGAPSTSPEALSVAASVDFMAHNWQFRAVAFDTPTQGVILTEAIESTAAKPIKDAGNVSDKLVYLGTAAVDLTPEQVQAVRGHVAFIDRGQVSFNEKLTRAFAAGAIGVVVGNNAAGQPLVMGGNDKVEIPAIMIAQATGSILKEEMKKGDVIVRFKTDEKINKPELIDSLASFSSRGPRSMDGALKPDISAPGANIMSAKMGGGSAGVRLSGTSMAAPHMAGVMALLKERYPKQPVAVLKSMVMGTALPLVDKSTGQRYPIAYMGAGRIRVAAAVTAPVIALPASLSLGEILIEEAKTVSAKLTLVNLEDADLTYTVAMPVDLGKPTDKGQALRIELKMPTKQITIKGHSSLELELLVHIDGKGIDKSRELDGYIEFKNDKGELRVPVLAVLNRTTRIVPGPLLIAATSEADAAFAVASLTLTNSGRAAGDALIFNLLGKDGRKNGALANSARNGICDLESSGWRLTPRMIDGQTKTILEIAVKVYSPMTTWNLCEVSVLFDKNGDGIAEQELVGSSDDVLTGDAALVNRFSSTLTDAAKLGQLRRDAGTVPAKAGATVSYTAAILDQQPLTYYDHSTLMVMSVDIAKLALTAKGDIRLKVVAQAGGSSPDGDDYLGPDAGTQNWLTITTEQNGESFTNLPDPVTLAAGETRDLSFAKGSGKEPLVVYFPTNRSTVSVHGDDAQSATLNPNYQSLTRVGGN